MKQTKWFNSTNWAHYNPYFQGSNSTEKSHSLAVLVFLFICKSPNLSVTPLPQKVLPSKSTLLYCFSSANFLINNSVFNLLRKTKINLSLSLSLSLFSLNNLHNLVKLLPPSSVLATESRGHVRFILLLNKIFFTKKKMKTDRIYNIITILLL